MTKIVEHSQEWNRAHCLTGCLHYEDGTFFQWLEGPKLTLYRLLEKLEDDPRHFRMVMLDQGPLEKRLFPNWQMRFSDHAAGSLMEWLAGADKTVLDANYYADGITRFLRSVEA